MQLQIGDELIKALIQYERLPNLCYICGHVDHTINYCSQRRGEMTVEERAALPYLPKLLSAKRRSEFVEVVAMEDLGGADSGAGANGQPLDRAMVPFMGSSDSDFGEERVEEHRAAGAAFLIRPMADEEEQQIDHFVMSPEFVFQAIPISLVPPIPKMRVSSWKKIAREGRGNQLMILGPSVGEKRAGDPMEEEDVVVGKKGRVTLFPVESAEQTRHSQ